MVKLSKTRCVLAVPGLATSLAYYRDQLGMELEFEAPGWAFLARGAFAVMLGDCPDALAPAATGDHAYFAYVTVEDVDALYAEFRARLLDFIKLLRDEPWGMREFGLRTVDGHRLMFGQELG